MRNIYTSKPRGSRLLDRLALISALTLAGIVSVDLLVYKNIIGFDRADVSNVVETAETVD